MGTLVSPTTGNLLKNTRMMLGQPDPSNSNWSDDALLTWLNEAVRVYFAEVTVGNEGQFTAVSDLDLVANQDTVTLPSDFFEVRVLYRKVTSGYQALPYVNSVSGGYMTTNSGTGNNYMPSYYFRNNLIVLRDPPGFAETGGLRLEYIQFPDTLVNGGDRLSTSISPIFKQVIEMYAVKKAKTQQSLVTGGDVGLSQITAHFNELYAQFKEIIRGRSKYPQFIQPYNPEGQSY